MSRETTQAETLVLHAGTSDRTVGSPVSSSIVPSTSFHSAPDAVGFSAADLTDATPHFYTRWANPTVDMLEAKLSELEGGSGAVSYASGMAAISALFLARLNSGDHLIMSNICYAGAAELAQNILPRFGIAVSMVDTSDLQAISSAIRPGVTKLIHIETPANPILRLSDIEAIAEIARQAGAELSVDSTIATPIATKPISLGADYVVHSLTKYICGHGDALGGAIVVRNRERLPGLRQGALVHHGAALSPFAAWLIARGMETLPIRMRAHEENAGAVADFLQSHSKVANVYWPGLSSHPQGELARKQMKNFSGLLSFTVKSDGMALARQFAEQLEFFSYAVSLGKTKSLLYYIPTADLLRTSFKLSAKDEEQYRAQAGDGVFRVSVGLEHKNDLIRDLAHVLG